MENHEPEWQALFEWLRAEVRGKDLPTCPRSAFPETLDAETRELLRLHVNHWLATDEWPPADEPLDRWLHVFLAYALQRVMEYRKLGAPVPQLGPPAKGVVQGILNRDWPVAAEAWLDSYLRIRQARQAREN